jgi:hypothetical protein
MSVQLSAPRIRGYCRHPLLHDATVASLEVGIGLARVHIDASHDRQVVVAFHGVVAVDAIHPEGMRFSTLTCWDSESPHYRFEFANWFQPGDDWDPWMAECRLDVIASSFTVLDSGHSSGRNGHAPEIS